MRHGMIAALIVLLLVGTGFGETDADPARTWIFFADKAIDTAREREAALATLAAGYDSRAVDRRSRRRTAPGLFDEADLPVADSYVDAVVATGAGHHVTSRWLNAISVRASSEQLAAIATFPFVRAIQPVGRAAAVDPAFKSVAPGGVAGAAFYGMTAPQLEQIGLPAVHDGGASGAGIVIGILDTGFNRSHQAFNDPLHPLQVLAEFDFVDGDPSAGIDEGDPSGQHYHGTLILGVLGAYWPETLVGAAYDASFILCKTEDTTDEYQGEEDNYVAGLEFIEANGGDVATSSLGYIDWYTQGDLDGQTAVTTLAVNIATANGVFCCTAAGNGGHDEDPATSTLLAPADAFSVITCGAVNVAGEIAGFSSNGPSADGRVKPEVLAMGVDTVTVHPNDDGELTSANGTSLSTPLVAGAVACLAQARPGWSVETLRTFLFETGDWFTANGSTDPLFVHGYGVIDAAAALAADCNGNSQADAAEIDAGAPDMNGNGRLDVCDADLNGDLAVDVQDLVAIILAWGPCPPACPEDMNADGEVDVSDLVFLVLAWTG